MHRFLLGSACDGFEVDHWDGNGLNNRRLNIRVASRRQNIQNLVHTRKHSSRFKGVTWDKENRKWRVTIQVDGVPLRLGRFENEEESAAAYDAAARKHFGEFAHLNL